LGNIFTVCRQLYNNDYFLFFSHVIDVNINNCKRSCAISSQKDFFL